VGGLAQLLLYDIRRQFVVRRHSTAFWIVGWSKAPLLWLTVSLSDHILCTVIETVLNQRRAMTLPDERYRALKWAESFLQDLQDPSKTPRVPKEIRLRARSVLRHYPGSYYIEELARRSPDIITPQMEALHRFVRSAEQDPECTNTLGDGIK
jgi:hypothetical protein